ncbi:MAG: hypothetical protein H6716_13525 [Polyangiaceae bacterium]|nr:hypothetical protein [Polyangiaceae bacterium]
MVHAARARPATGLALMPHLPWLSHSSLFFALALRKRRAFRIAYFGVSGCLLGCSGGAEPEEETVSRPIPCEVQQVLERNCLRCHGEEKQYGAPYSFISLDEIHRVRGGEPLYRRMLDALEEDFMPPVTLKVEPPVQDISDTDRDVLIAWTRAGAPEGEACQ